jgi:hypothetical protein
MKPQEANKLIAEFMGVYSEENGYDYTEIGNRGVCYHTSWDWLMPVITRVKNIDRDWIDQGGQKFIDEIDDALTCWGGILDVHHDVVDAIMNYNEYKS